MELELRRVEHFAHWRLEIGVVGRSGDLTAGKDAVLSIGGAGQPQHGDGRGLRIDDPVFRDAGLSILAAFGYQVALPGRRGRRLRLPGRRQSR